MTYYWICNKSNTTVATSGAVATYLPGAPRFLMEFVLLSFRCFVSCFVYYCLSFFFWPWHCLSVFELLLMITHLVSYSRFKSTLGLMLICCLCIYIPILNKIYLLTYLLQLIIILIHKTTDKMMIDLIYNSLMLAFPPLRRDICSSNIY